MAPLSSANDAASTRRDCSDARKRKRNKRVESVKKLIRDYENGKRPANREVSYRTLYLGEYRQLLEEIRDDATLRYIVDETQFRYDYTANNRGQASKKRSKQFALRTPTAIHERLSDEIDDAIKRWRRDIEERQVRCGTRMCSGESCTDENTIEIAQKLKGHRSESVKNLKLKESDKKDPDLSYVLEEGYDTYRDTYGGTDGGTDDGTDDNTDDEELDNEELDIESQWPGLVVEIGWSQPSDKLRQKCEWYIENSNGEVRTVIGVDLHELFQCYPKPKTEPRKPTIREIHRATKKDISKMVEATKKNKAVGKIFLWRADIDSSNGAKAVLYEDKPQIFRNENGNPTGEVALRLFLDDFISPRFLGRIGPSHNPELVITPKQLCDRFKIALIDQISTDRELEEKEREKKAKKKVKSKEPARENATEEGA
ncbi:hypothetical protein GGR51DRAFT_528005 [Nemania sp. FL0031]|nr:hypothetical protein GGR51DRAFT_528005 [Nemania sp. FL0031]